jgi:integrase
LSPAGQHMIVCSLEQMISRAGLNVSIHALHPPRLRHTFATRFLTLRLGDTFQLSTATWAHEP